MSRLKPRPTKLADCELTEECEFPEEFESPEEGELPELCKLPDVTGGAVKGWERVVGRGFSSDISTDSVDWALAPDATEVIGPKRSESSTAIGRAPMVKISRRIPPTPVAAP